MNINDVTFIDKTKKGNSFEISYKNYIQLRENQLNTNNENEYKQFKNLITDIFKEMLLNKKPTMKYFVKGTPEERELIIRKHKISMFDCILINKDEMKINIFSKLAGRRGNIIWLHEDVIELWSIKNLIGYLC